jgi:hypothetical protein
MTQDYERLFGEYLRVCNEALERHKHCFPYNRIIYQIEELLESHAVQAALFENEENHPVQRFDMILKDGRLTAQAPHRPHVHHPWCLSRYFLEKVAQSPDTYINNPAQLNWQWLTDHKVGI